MLFNATTKSFKDYVNSLPAATDVSSTDIVSKEKTSGDVVKVDGSEVPKSSDFAEKSAEMWKIKKALEPTGELLESESRTASYGNAATASETTRGCFFSSIESIKDVRKIGVKSGFEFTIFGSDTLTSYGAQWSVASGYWLKDSFDVSFFGYKNICIVARKTSAPSSALSSADLQDLIILFTDKGNVEYEKIATKESLDSVKEEIGVKGSSAVESHSFVACNIYIPNGSFTPTESGSRGGCEDFIAIPTDGSYYNIQSSSTGVVFFYSTNASGAENVVGNSGYWIDLNTYKVDSTKFPAAKFFRVGTSSNSPSVTITKVKDSSGIQKDIADLQKITNSLGVFGEDILVVDQNGKGNFTTIEEALAAANDTDSHRVTIVVMPGTYYPAWKINNVAPYREANRNIALVGLDKNACFLVGECGYYRYQDETDTTPLRISGNVLIKNLTIKSLSTRYAEYKSQYGWTSTTNQRAYCIHNDYGRKAGQVTEINNCVLINDHFTCVGFGLRKESTLRIVDTYMETTADGLESGGFGLYGTLYGHVEAGQDGNNQNLEVLNSLIVNDVSDKAVSLMDVAGRVANGSYRFIGTAVKTTNKATCLNIGNSFTKDSLSFGNNVEDLNA